MEIFQDSDGFLWFGTIDGLNKYDGYEFTIYRPIINDPHSISNNRINSIAQDGLGNLWVGTSNGLNVFNKGTGKFYRIKLDRPKNYTANIGDVINDLFYDGTTNTLWIATSEGLSRLPLNGATPTSYAGLAFDHYVNKNGDSTTIDNNNVTNILEDKDGVIWMGTDGKYLNRYNSRDNNFQRILINVPNSYELDHIPKAILIDNEGDFWIGNDLSRLIIWHRNNKPRLLRIPGFQNARTYPQRFRHAQLH